MLPGLAAFDSTAIIPGVGLPVTASNVVLPDSNDTDEDVDLYRDSRKGNGCSYFKRGERKRGEGERRGKEWNGEGDRRGGERKVG